MKEWAIELFISLGVWVRLLIAFIMILPLRVFLFDSWLVPFMPVFVAVFMEAFRKFFPESKVYYVMYCYVMIGIIVLVVIPWTGRVIDREAHVVYTALGNRAQSEQLAIADTIQPSLDLEIEKVIVEQSHVFQNSIAQEKIDRVKAINEKIKTHGAKPEDIEEAKKLLQELRELRKGTGLDPVPHVIPAPLMPDTPQKDQHTRAKVASASDIAPPLPEYHPSVAVTPVISEQERLHMDSAAYQEYKSLLEIQHSDIVKHPTKVNRPPIVVRKDSVVLIEVKNAVLSSAVRVGEFTGTLPKGLYIGAFKVVDPDTVVRGRVAQGKNNTLILTLTTIDASPFALAIQASCTYVNTIFTEVSSSSEADSRTLRFVVSDDAYVPEDFFTTRP